MLSLVRKLTTERYFQSAAQDQWLALKLSRRGDPPRPLIRVRVTRPEALP